MDGTITPKQMDGFENNWVSKNLNFIFLQLEKM